VRGRCGDGTGLVGRAVDPVDGLAVELGVAAAECRGGGGDVVVRGAEGGDGGRRDGGIRVDRQSGEAWVAQQTAERSADGLQMVCRRSADGWGVAQGCVDREDGEVVLLTAPEKLRRRQGLRRGEQRVSDAAAGLSPSHCACGVPQLGRSQVISSCEQRSKSHRIHHEHHCIPIPYQFHNPFGSLHDSHVPFPHVQA
jgi:hypothetical protein